MSKVTINKINTPSTEGYTKQDLKLIPAFDIISQFIPEEDNVEFSIYNEQGLLEYINYNYTDYTVTLDYNTQQNAVSTVNVDVENDVINEGYEQGNYTANYNFLRNQLSSSANNPYYIKQISSDRTEIRVANNDIENGELEAIVNQFKTELSESAYFEDFQINLGNNNIFIANNILIDTSDSLQYTVLIKLYEPLEEQFEVKDTLWVTLQTADETSYQVNFTPKVIVPPPPPQLKGPNFNIETKDIANNSTTYQNLDSLFTTVLTSSYNELQGVLQQKGITVNVDYSDFNNFIYFSSAEERVRNFYYKVGLIEEYDNEISTLSVTTATEASASVSVLETQKRILIENFDEYEKYQYYTSGTLDLYPKNETIAPFTLAGTGSEGALNWLASQSLSGSNYDRENPDRLINTLPSFVVDNSDNDQFLLFMDMIGQHFDNIWVYTKDISNRFDADNRLNYGVSKDIVADAIRSMGLKLYQNNFSSEKLYSAFTGINASGSLLPPTGSEIIENYVTASSNITVIDDINKEIYKRLYHNLPLLLKKKGTIEGLRTLISCYGIPDTILRISEFGGKDKTNSNDWDYFQSKFNYATYITGAESNRRINLPFRLHDSWSADSNRPETIMFRFKPGELPTGSLYSLVADFDDEGGNPGYLTLAYTGSGLSSASYSGSIPSSSNEYAQLTYWDGGTTSLLSASVPFYNGNFWSVFITREASKQYNLAVGESIYNGNDGFKLGHFVSTSVVGAGDNWSGVDTLRFPYRGPSGVILGGNTYTGLSGSSYQEVRFYNEVMPYDAFKDYVMNPYSIEGINYSSSAENLAFRAPLGSDLNTSTGAVDSIHPKVTGSFATSSFPESSSYTIEGQVIFIPNTEFIYYDQPAVGIKNRISEKIRLEDNIIPSGDTLTPYTTIQQRYPQSESYTRDINYLEVAFSPQNEINDDINSSFGYFNIGEYIGDPRQVSESNTSYQDLDRLRNDYFQKYYKSYDWKDYIRLIKYFDNSLFKMIKDFVPAKTNVSTGVVIKQHLLERNKQRPAQLEISQHEYSGSITSSFIEGINAWDYSASLTTIGFNSRLISRISQSYTAAPAWRNVGGVEVSIKGGEINTGSNTAFTWDPSAGEIGINPDIDPKYYPKIPLTIDAKNYIINYSALSELTMVLSSSVRGEMGSVEGQGAGPTPVAIHAAFKTVYFTTGSEKFSIFLKNLSDPNPSATYQSSTFNYLGISSPERFETTLANNSNNNDTLPYGYDITIENTDQSYDIYHDSQKGVVTQSIIDYREFYNGEFVGEDILITDGKLNVPVIKESNASFIAPYGKVRGYQDETLYSNQTFNDDGILSFLYTIETAVDPRDGITVTNEGVFRLKLDQNDENGVSRLGYFRSLLPGDVLTFRVSDGASYIYPGAIFEFVIDSIQEYNPFGNIWFEIDFSYSNANYGDWAIASATNGLIGMNLELIYDDSLNQFQGFLGENSNPTYNNTLSNRFSTEYMDIDYSSGNGILQPTNFIQILSGSAVKAQVADSNYSQKSWINGRYNGTRVSSTDFNQFSRNTTGLK